MEKWTFLLAAALMVWGVGSRASEELCAKWGQPRQVGSLDGRVLPEASGLVVDGRGERLFHVNDSGNDAEIVISDLNGGRSRVVALRGIEPIDTEEITRGPCGERRCLFIGDIGDNNRERDEVIISWLPEKAHFAASEEVAGRLRLRYPDGAHNAEAMVVDSNGDLFIFTKEFRKKKERAKPAAVFRVGAEELRSPGRLVTMVKVGEVDVPSILPDADPGDQVVTGAALSPDGRRLLLLTYRHVVEMKWVLSSSRPRDYRLIELPENIPQAEGVAFMPDGKSFMISSEVVGDGDAPLFQVGCAR